MQDKNGTMQDKNGTMEDNVRDSGDFQRQSRRTWTTDPHTDLTRGWQLLGDIDDAARKLDETLDEHKRALFYGDDSADVLRATTGEDFILEQLDEDEWDLIHGALGAATEAGEILEQVRNCLSQGNDVDMDNVREEIGDLLYYLARLADVSDTTLLEEMQRNNSKLRERFPDEFSTEDALDRDVDSEREVMEIHQIEAGKTLGEIAEIGLEQGWEVTELEWGVEEGVVNFAMSPRGGDFGDDKGFSDLLYELGMDDRCRVAYLMVRKQVERRMSAA